MTNPADQPEKPRPHGRTDYDDPHYHDEDEVAPPPDDAPGKRPSARRKPLRRPPPRRPYPED